MVIAFSAPVPIGSSVLRESEAYNQRRTCPSPRAHRPRIECTSRLPDWAVSAARKHGGRAAPHAGSHFARRGGKSGRFFEGWYLRAVLPDAAFAWMFSVEESKDGQRDVVAQFLGADEVLHVQRFPGGEGWFSDAENLRFGHWDRVSPRSLIGEPRVLSRTDFRKGVESGFQMTAGSCSGRLPGCENSKGAVAWEVDIRPLLAWGTRGEEARCTATWLSYLPVFEPGYQILIAHGIAASGFVEYQGRSRDLAGAKLYAEKNWGGSFPQKWWWVQANGFSEFPDLTLTAVGARRLIGNIYLEDIGMIAIHLNGEMYEFSNWNATKLSWAVSEWGSWEATATARTGHYVRIRAETIDAGTEVLGPSLDGMVYNVRDAAYGELIVELRSPGGGVLLDNARCTSAQVEVGGGPWDSTWNCDVKPLSQPLRGMINLGARKVQTSV